MDHADVRPRLEEYRRGVLPAELAARIEAHLGECAPCRELLEAEATLAGRIAALPRPAAPVQLQEAVARLATSSGKGRRWRRWGAVLVGAGLAAALLLTVLPWGRLLGERAPGPVEQLIRDGVSEHRRLLLQLEADPEPVRDPGALLARVESVAHVKVHPAFTGPGGLALLGAHPTLIVDRRSAAVALRTPTGPVATCFIFSGSGLEMPASQRVQIDRYRPHLKQVDDVHVVFWTQGELGYLIVSSLGDQESRQLYLTVRRAL